MRKNSSIVYILQNVQMYIKIIKIISFQPMTTFPANRIMSKSHYCFYKDLPFRLSGNKRQLHCLKIVNSWFHALISDSFPWLNVLKFYTKFF